MLWYSIGDEEFRNIVINIEEIKKCGREVYIDYLCVWKQCFQEEENIELGVLVYREFDLILIKGF